MSNTIQEQGPATYTLMRERVEAVRARDGATNEPASNDGPPDTATILRGLTSQPADKTLLAGTAPLPRFAPTADVENDGDRGPALRKTRSEAQAECDRANEPLDERRTLALAAHTFHMKQAGQEVVTVLDLRDPEGERLRIEADMRDARTFLTIGEPDAERPFELSPEASVSIARTLVGPSDNRKPVQQAAAPVKKASPRVLTDADRDDADRTMLRARCDDLANELPPHHVRVLSRMLGELPPGKLLQHLEAITADAVEGAGAPNNYRASGWEEQARAALLEAWRAYERLMLRPDEPHTPRHTVHDYTSGAVAAEHAKGGAK